MWLIMMVKISDLTVFWEGGGRNYGAKGLELIERAFHLNYFDQKSIQVIHMVNKIQPDTSVKNGPRQK